MHCNFQGKKLLNRQVYNELYTCEPFSFSGDAVPARRNTLCELEVIRIVFPRDSAAARNEPNGHDKSSKWLAFKIFSSVFVYGLSLSLCLILSLSLSYSRNETIRLDKWLAFLLFYLFVFVFDFIFVFVLILSLSLSLSRKEAIGLDKSTKWLAIKSFST